MSAVSLLGSARRNALEGGKPEKEEDKLEFIYDQVLSQSSSPGAGTVLQSCPELQGGQPLGFCMSLCPVIRAVPAASPPPPPVERCGFGQEDSLPKRLRAVPGAGVSYELSSGNISSSLGNKCL